MSKLKIVNDSNGKRRAVVIEVCLGSEKREKLQAYLDHIGMSVEAFVRCLILKELQEETIAYRDIYDY